MIIVKVTFQNLSEMPFSQDDHMVQAVPPDRSDQPLHKGSLPWTGRSAKNFFDNRRHRPYIFRRVAARENYLL
jgi:hypothetical protein